MLMKYKDFKMLSIDDMKQITGGSADGGCSCATLFTGGGTIAHCLGTQSHPHDCAAGSCTVGQPDCNSYCYKGTLSCWSYS
jgi:hypothetical protein